MKPNRCFFTLSILLLSVFAFAGAGWGEQVKVPVRTGNAEDLRSVLAASSAENGQGDASLRLGNFTVETADDKVRFLFGLILENPLVVRALLRDGAVIHLTCTLSLERLRTVLSNKTVAEAGRVYLLRHDPLTREFVSSSPQGKTIRQRHFETLIHSLFEVMIFELPLTEPLVSGETYRLRLTLSMQHAEVPPWLEKTLFFWSWDVAPPLSFSQDFVY